MKVFDSFSDLKSMLPSDAAKAEVQLERQDVLAISISSGVEMSAAASDLTECFIRASGTKTGHFYTQKLDEDPARLIAKAFENSQYASSPEPEPMNRPEDLDEAIFEPEPDHLPVDQLREKAAELEKILLTAGSFSHSTIHLSERILTMGLINTLGCQRRSSRRVCEAETTLVLEKEGRQEICDLLLSARTLDELSPDWFLTQYQRWIDRHLPFGSCGAGSYRAILDASVVCNIFATAWQLFAAPFYLKQKTPLAGRLGQDVFSKCITLCDVPYASGSGYTFPFDCEGSDGRPATLVEKGRLTALLQTLASARIMGLKTTGNAGRKTLLSGSVQTQVTAMPKNFMLLPGQATPDDLLKELGNGLYIDESYDVFHSINIASGAFSIPCRALVIRDQKPVSRVSGLTLTGHVCDLLSNVALVANDLLFQPMVLLKSYTVGAPSLLVSRLEVSGQ